MKERIEQHRGALGYSLSGDVKADQEIRNYIAEALRETIDTMIINANRARIIGTGGGCV